MTSDQQQAALAHLQKHHGLKPCPSCGSIGFGLQAQLYVSPSVETGMSINLTQGLALLAAVCNTCGFVMFYNAKKAGVI